MTDSPARIVKIDLDRQSIVRWSREVEHERDVAVFDLIEENSFALKDGPAGPYEVMLSLRDGSIILAVSAPTVPEPVEIVLSVRPLRGVIKDYFLICENYFQAIKGAPPSRVEAVDMARRGLHNEGSELLTEVLEGKVVVDRDTARRLFTLVCVLHIRS